MGQGNTQDSGIPPSLATQSFQPVFGALTRVSHVTGWKALAVLACTVRTLTTFANPHRDGAEWAPAQYDPHSQIMGDHRKYHFFMASIPIPAFLQTAAEVEQKANEGKTVMVTPGEWLEIKTWQVNDDGAGPFRCRIDETSTGHNFGGWLEILQQPPDSAEHYSVNPHTNAQAHTLKVKIPDDIKCKSKAGKYKNICLMRCENYAANGPFGGCVPFNIVYPKSNIRPLPVAKPLDTKKPQKPVKGNPGYDVGKNTYQEQKYGDTYFNKRNLEQKRARRANVASAARLTKEK
ncbi:hypothetical protein TWF718_004158 [Orbilia javanica]|uniref:Uncharacterized protein n=1 Tax=Orbilia javanica TaxID=47235 RepID=A0AAN8RET2_9PEZI